MSKTAWWIASAVHALAIVLNAYALALTGAGTCAAFIGLSIVCGAHAVTKARNA